MKSTAISKLSVTALDNIIEDIHLLLESRVQSLKDSLGAVFHQQQIEFDSELATIFQNPTVVLPFQDLQTNFLRKRYYTEEMGLLVCYC